MRVVPEDTQPVMFTVFVTLRSATMAGQLYPDNVRLIASIFTLPTVLAILKYLIAHEVVV